MQRLQQTSQAAWLVQVAWNTSQSELWILRQMFHLATGANISQLFQQLSETLFSGQSIF